MSDYPRWGATTTTEPEQTFPSWGTPRAPAAPPAHSAPADPQQQPVAKEFAAPTWENTAPAALQVKVAQTDNPAYHRDLMWTAIAMNRTMNVPMEEAITKARALADAPTPEAKRLGKAVADNYRAQQLTVRIGELESTMITQADPAERARILAEVKKLEAQLPALEDIMPLYSGVVGKVQSFGRTAVTGAAGLVAQQLESATGTTVQDRVQAALFDETLSPAQRVGRLVAAGTSYLTSSGRQEAGGAYRSMADAGVPHEVAAPIAKGVGALNNVIEIAGVGAFVAMFPGADQVARRAIAAVTKRVGIEGGIKNLGLRMAAKWAGGVASELGEEVAQQTVTYLGQELASEISRKEYGLSPEQQTALGGQLGQLVTESLPGMMVMGALAPVAELGKTAVQSAARSTARAVAPGTAVESVTGAPKQTEVQTIRGRIDATTEAIRSAIAAQEAAETQETTAGQAPAAPAVPVEQLAERAAEVDQAITTRLDAIDTSAEITDDQIAEILDLADMKDEVTAAQKRYSPAESAAPAPEIGPATEAATAQPSTPSPAELGAEIEGMPERVEPPAAPPAAAEVIPADIRARIREALPQFSEREIQAAGLMVDIKAKSAGVETSQYVSDTFAPGVFAPADVAEDVIAKRNGANAAVQFLEDGKALLHAVQQTDFKALVHEFTHVFVRQLGTEQRSALDAAFGGSEERIAEGYIRYLQTGDPTQDALRPLFDEMSDLLARARTAFDDLVPDEVKPVYDQMLAGAPARAAAEGGETLYNPMAMKAPETTPLTRRNTSVQIGDVYLSRQDLAKLDQRLPDVMESYIRGNNPEGLATALRDMEGDLMAAGEPARETAVRRIRETVEQTPIDDMAVRTGPGNVRDVLFNAPEDQAAFEDARRFDSPDEYAAFSRAMDLDPRPEESYRQEWEAAQTSTPSRERENQRFLASIDTKEGLEAVLLDLWRAESERPQLPNMDVHNLLKSAVDKAPKGISDAHYTKLMAQIRDNPTRYRAVIAQVLGDEAAADQIAREQSVDPDAAALEKAKETNRELRRQNKELQKKIGQIEKAASKEAIATLRERTRAEMATEKARQIAGRARAAAITSKATVRDLLEQIREEQAAQEAIVKQAEAAYRDAVREGKTAAAEARGQERERAQAKLAELRGRMEGALTEQKEKLAAYRDAVRTKAYVGRLIKSIMRKPGSGVTVKAARQITALQDRLVVNGTEAWKQLRDKLETWQMANPGKSLPPEGQRIVDQLSVRDMTVQEIEDYRQEVEDARTAGRQALLRRKAGRMREKESLWNDVLSTLSNLDPKKVLPRIAGGKDYEDATKTGPAGKINWIAARPNRWAMWLDGGKKGPNYELLINAVNAAEDEKVTNVGRRHGAIAAKLKELGLKSRDIRRTFRLSDGTLHNHNEALAVYLYEQNIDAQRHLRGETGVSEQAAKEFIAQLSPAEKQLGDFLMGLFQGQDKDRFLDFCAEWLNMPTEGVEKYFPIVVEDVVYERHEEQIAQDIVGRTGVKRASVNRGSAENRVKSKKRISLNAMLVAMDAIEKHEHLLAYQKVVEELNHVYNSPTVQKELVRVFGDDATKIIRQYIAGVANPHESHSYDPVLKLSDKLRSNVVLSGIVGNVTTYAKNFPTVGCWTYLPYTNGPRLLAANAQWVFGGKELYEFVTSRDPQVADRVIDPNVTTLKQSEWSKVRTVRDRVNRLGLAALEAFDLGTVLIGWKSVYDHVYSITEGDATAKDAAATEAAKDATLRTQPQGKTKDLPAMMQSPVGQWVTLFGNQLNQMWNLVAYDLPMTMKNREETIAKRVLWAARLATGFAVTGLVMGMIDRKRPPEGKEVVGDIASQFIAPVPALGDEILSLALGKGGYGSTIGGTTPLTPIVEAGQKVAKVAKEIREGDTDAAIRATLNLAPAALRLLGGPAVPAQRVIRAITEGDAWWLLGGPPRERE